MTLTKGVYHWENQNIHREFQYLFEANNSRPCIVPPRVSPRMPVAFVVGWLVLHWEHKHVIMYNYRGVGHQMYKDQACELFSLKDGAATQDLGTCVTTWFLRCYQIPP